MGLLRLLLSISVLIGHAGTIFGIRLLPGDVAVEAFFILSGFYMGLILNERYTGRNSSFYLYFTNRLFRLFPLYIFILLLTIGMCWFYHSFTGDWLYLHAFANFSSGSSPWLVWYLVLANVLLLGQSFMFFFGSSTGGTHFHADVLNSPNGLHHFQVVPQSWTLGLELVFYALAPLLTRLGTRSLFTLVTGSLLLRILTYFIFGMQDPWTYRFFPNELALFMAGLLSYRWYGSLKKKKLLQGSSALFLLIAMLITTFMFPFFEDPHSLLRWPYYLAIALSAPFIFHLSKKSKADALVGELTYPVYITHMLALVVAQVALHYTSISKAYTGEATLLLTLIFSVLLYFILIKPVERFRRGRLKR